MQKVITIHGQSFVDAGSRPSQAIEEITYPELQKLLDQGYKVKQTIPMQSSGNSIGYFFSITLLLEKAEILPEM